MAAEVTAVGAALNLRNITKRYGNFVAARDLCIDIEPGEFVTLLGPSGSGKTTTLNMIAGFIDISDGQILLDGRPIGDLPPYRRNIGMVFQQYALFPHMTAFENVAFPLKQRKVPKHELRRRVQEALAMVRLDDFGARYPRQLSGGQQQRVAFARAMVFSPQVLLMDEPLGALDKKLREWLQLEIRRIHREVGITFVYVTHDQEEALVLSNRIAVFNEGRIEQIGTAEDLYERPETLFVAEFIGESNLFPGRVTGSGDYVDVAADGYRVRAPANTQLTEGSRAVVVVRPERLHVVTEGRSGDDNVLEAVVRQIVYLGSARKLELEFADGRHGRVREPAGASSDVGEGDQTRVAWAPDEGVLLAEQEVHLPEMEDIPLMEAAAPAAPATRAGP
jgi:putative spermidine/putrescine transport system ATP-binding protein